MKNTDQNNPGTPRRLLFITALLLLGLIGIAAWNNSASGPNDAALTALDSDSSVKVTVTDALITFEPANGIAHTALIFYPGGRVDFRAYAPALRMIAARGYTVFTPSMPLYLAFFDADAAERVIAANPGITTWAIGGHSLGGVAAAGFAAGSPQVSGVVFWASYPADNSLRQSQLPVLSVYGTLDGLSSEEEVLASRANLPASAQFIAIEGGNHAQFGAYGPQAGDNPAVISAQTQWQQVADATAAFLATLNR